jgi:hypothetical protein
MREKPLAQRIATLFLVGLIAATLLRTWDRLRSPPEPPPAENIVRPDLVRWAMPGCYAVRVDPWEFAGRSLADSAAAEIPAFLTPPSRIRLLPDSTDRWRRQAITYRAVPITGDHDPAIAEYLRWVVRADTLWVLWSNGRSGGGIALRQVGDSLLGAGRAFDRALQLDGTAHAAAWRLDCQTLERESGELRPRR